VFCVGVFCGSDLFTGVCVFVVFIVFSYTHLSYVHISSLFICCMSISRMYLCVTLRLITVFVKIINYFLFHTPHHSLPLSVGQSVLMLCKNRWG